MAPFSAARTTKERVVLEELCVGVWCVVCESLGGMTETQTNVP